MLRLPDADEILPKLRHHSPPLAESLLNINSQHEGNEELEEGCKDVKQARAELPRMWHKQDLRTMCITIYNSCVYECSDCSMCKLPMKAARPGPSCNTKPNTKKLLHVNTVSNQWFICCCFLLNYKAAASTSATITNSYRCRRDTRNRHERQGTIMVRGYAIDHHYGHSCCKSCSRQFSLVGVDNGSAISRPYSRVSSSDTQMDRSEYVTSNHKVRHTVYFQGSIPYGRA